MRKHLELIIVTVLLLGGLALRFWSAAQLWHWQDEQFPASWERSKSVLSQDGSQYVEYALAEKTHDSVKASWKSKSYYRPPLASYYFVDVIRLCGFNRLAVSAVQSALAVAAYLLIYVLCRTLFSRRIALVAMAAVMVHPVCIFYDVSFEDSSLALMLFSLSLFFLREPLRRDKLDWALAGVCFGLAMLARPNLNLAFPVIATYAFVAKRKGLAPAGNSFLSEPRHASIECGDSSARASLKILGLFTIAMFIVVAPAVWHNYRATGRFSFIVDTAGENLFWGNNDHPYYLTDMQGYSGIAQVDQGSPERLLKNRLKRECGGRNNDILFKKAFYGYVAAHPLGFIEGLAQKALRHLSNYEIPRNNNFYFLRNAAAGFQLPLIPFSLLLALAFLGVLLHRRALSPALLLVLAPWVAVAVSEIVFFNAGRYRAFSIPFIASMAVWGAFALIERFGQRRTCSVLLGLALCAGMVVAGSFCVSKKEKADFLAVSYYKAAVENLYPDSTGVGVISKQSLYEHLRQSLYANPANLDAFSLFEKFSIMAGDFDRATQDIEKRRERCGRNDPVCNDVCGFLDSLNALVKNRRR